MRLLNVEMVGASCIVRDMEGHTVLEVLGEKVHWVKDDVVGNSNPDFVIRHLLKKMADSS